MFRLLFITMQIVYFGVIILVKLLSVYPRSRNHVITRTLSNRPIYNTKSCVYPVSDTTDLQLYAVVPIVDKKTYFLPKSEELQPSAVTKEIRPLARDINYKSYNKVFEEYGDDDSAEFESIFGVLLSMENTIREIEEKIANEEELLTKQNKLYFYVNLQKTNLILLIMNQLLTGILDYQHLRNIIQHLIVE